MPVHYAESLPPTADLVIVGGGVVGAATAFHASRAGLRPLLLERRPSLATLTTPASTGAFRLQFDNREELELVRESADLFLHFAEVTGQTEFDLRLRQQGYLWLTTTEEGVARQRDLVTRQHAWGQTDIELLPGDEVCRRFPYVSPAVRSGRFRAGDGFLDPRALTFGLAAAAAVVPSCTVTGFTIHDGRLLGVETSLGTVRTEGVVIAGGPFSGVLAAEAGIALPVALVVRQKVVLPDVPEVPPGSPMTIDDDTGAHWRPALRGAYLLFTDPDTPDGPPLENVPTEASFAFRLLDPQSPISVARLAPFWYEVWKRPIHWFLQAGQYSVTPDHRPLIGPAGVEGVWVNTGYSGHGIMGSPAGSRLLVDLMTGALPLDANPFRLDREWVARELDRL